MKINTSNELKHELNLVRSKIINLNQRVEWLSAATDEIIIDFESRSQGIDWIFIYPKSLFEIGIKVFLQ